ncbi:MAG: hypothetical protein LBQ79_12185 [Deltaproteobacteria bacterium]|jgi:hypothetical protein|nr:hypothetical protein [Deltaproteobacteria bacterium]
MTLPDPGSFSALLAVVLAALSAVPVLCSLPALAAAKKSGGGKRSRRNSSSYRKKRVSRSDYSKKSVSRSDYSKKSDSSFGKKTVVSMHVTSRPSRLPGPFGTPVWGFGSLGAELDNEIASAEKSARNGEWENAAFSWERVRSLALLLHGPGDMRVWAALSRLALANLEFIGAPILGIFGSVVPVSMARGAVTGLMRGLGRAEQGADLAREAEFALETFRNAAGSRLGTWDRALAKTARKAIELARLSGSPERGGTADPGGGDILGESEWPVRMELVVATEAQDFDALLKDMGADTAANSMDGADTFQAVDLGEKSFLKTLESHGLSALSRAGGIGGETGEEIVAMLEKIRLHGMPPGLSAAEHRAFMAELESAKERYGKSPGPGGGRERDAGAGRTPVTGRSPKTAGPAGGGEAGGFAGDYDDSRERDAVLKLVKKAGGGRVPVIYTSADDVYKERFIPEMDEGLADVGALRAGIAASEASLRAESSLEAMVLRSRLGAAIANGLAERALAEGLPGCAGYAFPVRGRCTGDAAHAPDGPRSGDGGTGDLAEARRLLIEAAEALERETGSASEETLDAKERLVRFLRGDSGPSRVLPRLPEEVAPEEDLRLACKIALQNRQAAEDLASGKLPAGKLGWGKDGLTASPMRARAEITALEAALDAAWCLSDLGDARGAAQLRRQAALSAGQDPEARADDIPKTVPRARLRSDLGESAKDGGRTERAFMMHGKALAAFRTILGSGDRLTIASAVRFADQRRAKGEHLQSATLYARSAETLAKRWPLDPAVPELRLMACIDLISEREFESTLPLLHGFVEKMGRILGIRHPRFITAFANLGRAFLSAGDEEGAAAALGRVIGHFGSGPA